MYIDINCNRFRDNLRTYLDHMMSTGDRLLITRHGQPVAALVSPRDLEALEKVDNSHETLLKARQEAQLREFRTMKRSLEGEG